MVPQSDPSLSCARQRGPGRRHDDVMSWAQTTAKSAESTRLSSFLRGKMQAFNRPRGGSRSCFSSAWEVLFASQLPCFCQPFCCSGLYRSPRGSQVPQPKRPIRAQRVHDRMENRHKLVLPSSLHRRTKKSPSGKRLCFEHCSLTDTNCSMVQSLTSCGSRRMRLSCTPPSPKLCATPRRP